MLSQQAAAVSRPLLLRALAMVAARIRHGGCRGVAIVAIVAGRIGGSLGWKDGAVGWKDGAVVLGQCVECQ